MPHRATSKMPSVESATVHLGDGRHVHARESIQHPASENLGQVARRLRWAKRTSRDDRAVCADTVMVLRAGTVRMPSGVHLGREITTSRGGQQC